MLPKRSSGAPIFELELDGMSLHGGSLRHLLSVELKESMDQLDSLTVRISVPERAVEGLRFTRPGAPFVVRLGYSRAAMREVHGDILDVSHARSASGWEITLAGVDTLHRLKKKKLTRVWEGNHVQVINEIAGLCHLQPLLQGVSATGSVRMQLNEDVATVLSRIAKENNYFVRIEKGNILRFGRRGLAYEPTPLHLRWGDDILDVSLSYSLNDVVTEVTTCGQDYVNDEWVESTSTPADLRKISGGLTAPELMKMAFGDVPLLLDNAPQSQTSQVQERSQGEMQERAEKFLTGSCKCIGLPDATSGASLTLTGAGWPLSSTYIVKETTHSFDPGSGYTTAITFGSDSLPPGHERWWGGVV